MNFAMLVSDFAVLKTHAATLVVVGPRVSRISWLAGAYLWLAVHIGRDRL